MTLRLVIEHASHPQREREKLHPGGEFSIGRGAECSWQLEDPDQFVSRKHCVISGGPGRWLVTDASRGGLFIDGGDRALGPGNSAALENGMRLRLGDVVVRVEMMDAATAPARPAPPPAAQSLGGDGFFSTPIVAPPQVQRPSGLPQPFDAPAAAMAPPPVPNRPVPPPMFDDPFTLDPVTSPPRPAPVVQRPAPLFADPFAEPARNTGADPSPAGYDGGFGDFFGDQPTAPAAPAPGGFDDWGLPPDPAAVVAPVVAPVAPAVSPEPAPPPLPTEPSRSRERAVPVVERDAPRPKAALLPPAPLPPELPPSAAIPAQPDPALIQAFFSGLGITGADAATPEQMEAIGKRTRMLVEGLVHMLRTRAREKQNVRVAQTIIGSADVNPLKSVATTDEALASVIAPRGPGYLAPDAAIAAAFRDLADHQMRTWIGMQSALRQMIDRFDPAVIESEIETAGLIKSLLAGGRNAKLWQLYTDRYKDIARSAEDRFLGEVGADFRDAYEGNRRKADDPQT